MILAFLTSRLGKSLGVLVAFAAIIWGVHHFGYRAGVKAEQDAQAERVKKAQEQTREGEKKARVISAKVEAEHVRTVEKIRTITQTLYKEVPYAVPSDPTRGSLGNGFVRLHDAAAIGVPSLPNPAGRSDAEASGVTDVDLARTVIANYETCRVNAETVMAWQEWISGQAANYQATTGQKP